MFRGLFRISVLEGKRKHRIMLYRDAFQIRRETFVVHRTPCSVRWRVNGWRVSHRRSGFRCLGDARVAGRLIQSDYDTPREAKNAAMWVLMHRDNAQVAEAVAKAEEMNHA